jgi:hypothetical protein
MLHKRGQTELPPEIARGFIEDMRAFHGEPKGRQARRNRIPYAADAQRTLFRQAAAIGRERDVCADEGSCLKAKGNQEERMTVLIYVNTSKQVGDPDHLKVFADEDAAETWLQENDPEGVAFEYEVLE